MNTRTASRTQGQYYLHQTGLRVKARVKYSGLLLIMEVPDLKSGLQLLHFRNNLTRILHASSSSTVDQLAPKVTTECDNSNKELCITLDNMKKVKKKYQDESRTNSVCATFLKIGMEVYIHNFFLFLLFKTNILFLNIFRIAPGLPDFTDDVEIFIFLNIHRQQPHCSSYISTTRSL